MTRAAFSVAQLVESLAKKPGEPGPQVRPLTQRFWPKVNKSGPNGCWEWTGCVTAAGYGLTGGRTRDKNVKLYAHRVAYELCVGPIPADHDLDHLCRNPRCVNPAHLEPVLHRENLLRGTGYSARNARKTHCKRGHALSGDNITIRFRNGNPGRRCKLCQDIDNGNRAR